MKTAFFTRSLLDTAIVEVLLIASGKKINLLYEGAHFKGITYDIKELNPIDIHSIMIEIIPFNINDLKIYEDKFIDRIEYLVISDNQKMVFISDEEYYNSFIKKKQKPEKSIK